MTDDQLTKAKPDTLALARQMGVHAARGYLLDHARWPSEVGSEVFGEWADRKWRFDWTRLMLAGAGATSEAEYLSIWRKGLLSRP